MTTPEPDTALATVTLEKQELAPVPQAFSLVPHSLSEAIEFSKLIAGSNLCPQEYRGKPADVLLAVQLGLEVAGCSPLQALQSIAVINGRPSMWGDLVLAVVRNSGLLEAITERDPQEAWAKKEGRCEVLRRSEDKPTVRTFTYKMAEDAGLVKRSGGSGPWTTHPGRMLQMRARSWALRDTFGDVLKGLRIREEEVDTQAITAEPVRQMPKRKSETAAIDEFLGTKPAEPQPPETNTPPLPPVPENGANVWTGKIANITKKEGTTKGKAWTLFVVHTEAGEFGTFSESVADTASQFYSEQEAVTITWTVTKKGNKQLDTITLAATGEKDAEPWY